MKKSAFFVLMLVLVSCSSVETKVVRVERIVETHKGQLVQGPRTIETYGIQATPGYQCSIELVDNGRTIKVVHGPTTITKQAGVVTAQVTQSKSNHPVLTITNPTFKQITPILILRCFKNL